MSNLDPKQLQALYAEAMKLQAEGRHPAALDRYGRIIAANPRIAEAHFQIGRIHTAAGQSPRALPHLAAAAALKPAEPAIWQAWADAVALAADEAAETALLQAVKQAQLAPRLRIALQDRFAPHRPRPVPGIPPALRPVLDRIARLGSAGKLAEAERLATAEAARHPQSAGLANALGIAQLRIGRHAAALASFQRAASLERGYADALNNMGQLLLELNRAEEAVAPLRAAVMAAPNWPVALTNLADALNRTRQERAALAYARKAARLAPKAAPTLIVLANTHTRLGDHAAAAEVLRDAVAAAPTRPDALVLLAQALSRLGQDQDALALYDRALDLAPRLSTALSGKAQLLQTLGDFEAAEIWFRRCFQADPSNGENYRLFIASHKTRADDPLLAQMIARFDDPATRDTDRMNLGFAIAKALEDLKDYGRVFPYLNTANALMRKQWPYDIHQRLDEIRDFKAALEGFDFHAARIEGASDYAPIFVTGMPRSGTTLVEQIISSHSAVSGAGEVGIAAGLALAALRGPDGGLRRAGDVPDAVFAALGHNYADAMRARFPDAPHVTDKSILTYQYMGLIRLALPKARFVVVRRDPRDTLLSIYKNKFAEGTHLYGYSLRDLGLYYRSFIDMVEFWRARVPDWFHVVEYEDLVANPEAESRRLIDACGLAWEDQCLDFHKNTRKVETLSVFQVRQPISKGSVKAWQRYEAEIGEMVEALGDLLPEGQDGAA